MIPAVVHLVMEEAGKIRGFRIWVLGFGFNPLVGFCYILQSTVRGKISPKYLMQPLSFPTI